MRPRCDLLLLAVISVLILGARCKDEGYREAQALYEAGDYNRASEAFWDFIRNHPRSPYLPHAYMGVAWSEYNRGRYDECVAAVEIIRERWPGHRLENSGIYLEAQANFARGRYVEAAEETTRIIMESPNDPLVPEARFLRGRAHAALLRWTPAEEDFAAYLDLYPDTGPHIEGALLGRAHAMMRLARWGEAADNLDLFINRFPDSPDRERAMADLAHIMEAEDPAEARRRWEAYLNEFPGGTESVRAALFLAEEAEGRNDTAGAIRWWSRIHGRGTVDDASARAVSHLAELALAGGDTAGARALYLEAERRFASYPGLHSDALAFLAEEEFDRGDPLEGMNRIEVFLRLYPNDERCEILDDRIIDYLAENGNPREAADRLRAHIARYHTGVEDRLRLAELLSSARLYADAEAIVRDILNEDRDAIPDWARRSAAYRLIILRDLAGDLADVFVLLDEFRSSWPGYLTVTEEEYWRTREEAFRRENRDLLGVDLDDTSPHDLPVRVLLTPLNRDPSDTEAAGFGRTFLTVITAALSADERFEPLLSGSGGLIQAADLLERRDYSHLPASYYPLRDNLGAEWILGGRYHTDGDDLIVEIKMLRVDFTGIFPFEYSYRFTRPEWNTSARRISRETTERLYRLRPET